MNDDQYNAYWNYIESQDYFATWLFIYDMYSNMSGAVFRTQAAIFPASTSAVPKFRLQITTVLPLFFISNDKTE